MTGDDVRTARRTLGELWGLDRPLSASELGRVLGLQGRDPGESVIKWERGAAPVSGPVSLALELMIAGGRPADLEARLGKETPPPVVDGRLKVYSGCFDGRTEWLVAAPSQKAAAEALDVSLHLLRTYADDPDPEGDPRVLARPGVVFSRPYSAQGDMIEGQRTYDPRRPWPPIEP